MSDHEFEKQVQQKLGELKLRPSDAVWMEVERNIRTNKRRRRFLWLWSAALLVTLTTSGVVLYHLANRTSGNETVQVTTTSSNNTNNTVTIDNGQLAIGKDSNNVTASATATASTGNEPIGNKQLTIGNEPTDATAPTNATESIGNKQPAFAEASAHKLAIGKENTSTNKTTVKNNTDKHFVKKDKTVHSKRKRTKSEDVILCAEPAAGEPNDNEAAPQREELAFVAPVLAVHEPDAIATNKATTEPFSNIALNALMPDSATSANALAAMPIQRKTPSVWHWGVRADAGYSRISVSKLFQLKGLLGTDKGLAEDLAARSYNSPASNNSQFLNVQASTTPVKLASPIQPDFAASVGLFIQRTLSPRLKVSVGLEYSYMSVNTRVGKAFDSSIAVNIGTNSLKVVDRFYESPGYIDTVRGTYSSIQGQGASRVFYSQKQRYRFHYIEVPVLLNWQINKGKKMPPLVFEGGFSVGRLFSADALHYEGVKGVYYEDNSLFNRTQFNFVTGLSVGLFQNSKHPIWIGPDLRYSLNGLVDKSVSTGQYMWSTGISFKMLLGRL